MQGGPIKTTYFLRHHIIAANTDNYNHAVFTEVFTVQKLQQKTTSNNFFKMSVKYSLQISQDMVLCKCQC